MLKITINNAIINPLVNLLYFLPAFSNTMVKKIKATDPNSMGEDKSIDKYLPLPLDIVIYPFLDQTCYGSA